MQIVYRCEHDYKEIDYHKVFIGSGDDDFLYVKRTFLCSKCGKFKKS